MFTLRSSYILVVALLAATTHAYPSWLKCFVNLEEDEVVMNNRIVPFHKADHRVKIEVEATGDEWFHPTHLTFEEGAKLSLRLLIPRALEGTNVQYVMETTEGGVFEKGMCDGRRATSTSHSEPVVLELSGDYDEVEVWAGWATGHEAVRLTSRLTLKLADEQEF